MASSALSAPLPQSWQPLPGMSLIDWEAEWAESGTALAVGMVCAAALAVIVLLVMKRNKERNAAC